jgi:FtsZ-interacting cell division protein YlmF
VFSWGDGDENIKEFQGNFPHLFCIEIVTKCYITTQHLPHSNKTKQIQHQQKPNQIHSPQFSQTPTKEPSTTQHQQHSKTMNRPKIIKSPVAKLNSHSTIQLSQPHFEKKKTIEMKKTSISTNNN